MIKKKVIIFGASGQIGRNIIRKITLKNYKVTAVTRNAHKSIFLKTQAPLGYLDIVEENIFDQKILEKLIEPHDVCINLIGILYEKKNNSFKNIHVNFPAMISKICKNYNIDQKSHDGNDMRKNIFEKIFYHFKGIKIKKKKDFKNYSIFWNSFTGRRYNDFLIKALKQYNYLNYDDYLQILSNSKTTINTLGPSGLIGPRYFECMLSNSVCLAEESSLYEEIFIENENYISFKKDLSDFNEKLNFATSDSDEIKKIKKNAYNLVLSEHTYEKRAKDLIQWTSEL